MWTSPVEHLRDSTIRASEYPALSAKLMLACALTFGIPTFACFLTRLGTVDHLMLIRQFRYAILGIFVVVAATTPPDMISQFALAIPLLVLYGVSAGVSYVFRRREDGESGSCEGASTFHEAGRA